MFVKFGSNKSIEYIWEVTKYWIYLESNKNIEDYISAIAIKA